MPRDTPVKRIVSKQNGTKPTLVARPKSTKLRVIAIAPYRGKCMIEHQGVDDGPVCGIQLCHCLARRTSINDNIMTALEYHWGIERNSLNVDSRWNCFLAISDLHAKFDQGQWGLIPKLEVLQRYTAAVQKDGRGFGDHLRCAMEMDNLDPDADQEDRFHTYIFLAFNPIMKTRVILDYDHLDESDGETDDDTVTTSAEVTKPVTLKPGEFMHKYPFDSPPLEVKSHLHPKFVICSLGQQLLDSNHIDYPILELPHVKQYGTEIDLIIDLYDAWSQFLDEKNLNDPNFTTYGGEEQDLPPVSSQSTLETIVESDTEHHTIGRRRSMRLLNKKRFSSPGRPALKERVTNRKAKDVDYEISDSEEEDEVEGTDEVREGPAQAVAGSTSTCCGQTAYTQLVAERRQKRDADGSPERTPPPPDASLTTVTDKRTKRARNA